MQGRKRAANTAPRPRTPPALDCLPVEPDLAVGGGADLDEGAAAAIARQWHAISSAAPVHRRPASLLACRHATIHRRRGGSCGRRLPVTRCRRLRLRLLPGTWWVLVDLPALVLQCCSGSSRRGMRLRARRHSSCCWRKAGKRQGGCRRRRPWWHWLRPHAIEHVQRRRRRLPPLRLLLLLGGWVHANTAPGLLRATVGEVEVWPQSSLLAWRRWQLLMGLLAWRRWQLLMGLLAWQLLLLLLLLQHGRGRRLVQRAHGISSAPESVLLLLPRVCAPRARPRRLLQHLLRLVMGQRQGRRLLPRGGDRRCQQGSASRRLPRAVQIGLHFLLWDGGGSRRPTCRALLLVGIHECCQGTDSPPASRGGGGMLRRLGVQLLRRHLRWMMQLPVWPSLLLLLLQWGWVLLLPEWLCLPSLLLPRRLHLLLLLLLLQWRLLLLLPLLLLQLRRCWAR